MLDYRKNYVTGGINITVFDFLPLTFLNISPPHCRPVVKCIVSLSPCSNYRSSHSLMTCENGEENTCAGVPFQ